MSWTADNLDKEKHCFFGAAGGVSAGKYTLLNTNLSSRDNPENLRCNIPAFAFRRKYENYSRIFALF